MAKRTGGNPAQRKLAAEARAVIAAESPAADEAAAAGKKASVKPSEHGYTAQERREDRLEKRRAAHGLPPRWMTDPTPYAGLKEYIAELLLDGENDISLHLSTGDSIDLTAIALREQYLIGVYTGACGSEYEPNNKYRLGNWIAVTYTGIIAANPRR